MSYTQRLLHLDVIRVIAMLMVIVLHTILSFTDRPDFFLTPIYFLFEPIVVLSSGAVMLFFMLSGYLVISKKRSISDTVRKTVIKLGIPLLFFTGINAVIDWFTTWPADKSLLTFIGYHINHISYFPSSSLWFLHVLIFLYLLNPLWQRIFTEDNKALALYLTKGACIFTVITNVLPFFGLAGPMFSTYTAWTGYAFFYLYGGLIRAGWVDYKNNLKSWILLGIGFIWAVIADYITGAQQATGVFSWYPQHDTTLVIPSVMIVVAVFHLLLNTHFNLPDFVERTVQWVAEMSFGVYLIHTNIVFVLMVLFSFTFDEAGLNVYVYNVVNFGLVLGISLLITYVIKKIPYVRALIGG